MRAGTEDTSMKRTPFRFASLFALPMLIAACGAAVGPEDNHDPVVSPTVCPKQSEGTTDGHAITICEEGYPEAPFVRPPPDSASTVFAGLDMRGKSFVSRGDRIDATAIMGSLTGAEIEPGPNGDRYAYAIYEVTLGSDGKAQSATPVILINDAVFWQSYMIDSDLEGLISKRNGIDPSGAPTFELTPSAPIRLKTSHDLQPMPAGQHGFPYVKVTATVSNRDASILASDGTTCLAALSSLGDTNPFAGVSTGMEPVVSRVPDMHGQADDVWVIEWPTGIGGSDMSPALYVAPWNLITPTAATFEEAMAAPHGNPSSAPFINVKIVKGGGQSCP
jgi:hypothetical protein